MRYELFQIFIIVLCFNLPYIFNWLLLKPRDQPQEVKVVYRDRPKYQYEHSFKVKAEKEEEKPSIKGDCVQALVSLGMKKSLSKEKVDKMFNKKDYLSIEDFLMDAYKID